MNIGEIRAQFATQLGDERYREFLEQFNRTCRKRGRLNHWHEKEWNRFCAESAECSALEFDDLVPIFRVCYVHLTELSDATIPIIKDLWDVHSVPAPGAEPRPYSKTYSIDSPSFSGLSELTVDRCPECFRGMTDRPANEIRDEFNRGAERR